MRFYSRQRKKTRKPLAAKLIRNHFILLGFDLLKINSRWQPSSKAIGMVIVLIAGVCGCGKTTIGKALAEKMGWPFEDADCYHPAANVSKMKEGIPLTDEDRLPWLVSLHEVIQKWCNNSQSGILACSALKRSYRQIIIYGKQSPGTDETSQNLITVFLEGSRQLIQERMLLRDQHFMPISLLDSQIEIYERSDNSSCSLNINIEKPVDEILHEIIEQINKMLKN